MERVLVINCDCNSSANKSNSPIQNPLLLTMKTTHTREYHIHEKIKGRSGKFQLVLAKAVIVGSESHGTRDPSLFSHSSRRHPKVKGKVVPVLK
jgi:hypothetical protein